MKNNKVIVKMFNFETDKYIKYITNKTITKYPTMIDDITKINLRNDYIVEIIDILSVKKENILVLSQTFKHIKLLDNRIYNNGNIRYMPYGSLQRHFDSGFNYRAFNVIISTCKASYFQILDRIINNVQALKDKKLTIIDISDNLPLFYKNKKKNYKENNCVIEEYDLVNINVYKSNNIITLKNALLNLNCYNFLLETNYDVNFHFL